MSRKPPAAVLWGKLAWHPAVAAWREIAPEAPEPESIEVLRQGRKAATYRLAGVGPGGAPVIAQRSRAPKGQIERVVYERILPHLPVTAPAYLGSRQESAEYLWLFLEDVGDERCSKTEPQHLALAAGWLGRMHTSATDVAAARELPDGGPSRYLDHLRAGRDTIVANLRNPALASDDATLLERLACRLESLESAWARLEDACAGAPATLVHGDFQPKNAYIRPGANGPEVFPIDWETAGWGVPAADLARLDVATYQTVVQPTWPELRPDDVRRLAACGTVFRALAAIFWVSPQLAYDTAHWLILPLSKLRCYERQLSEGLVELGALP
jgi:hypothetical protein